MDPANQALGGELGDVPADRDRCGAEQNGQVGDPQYPVVLQCLKQLSTPGGLQWPALV
jgi:hypothetical protein